MATLLAGVDVGTTGTKCVIFDLKGAIRSEACRENETAYPRPGGSEQDGEELIDRTMEANAYQKTYNGLSRGSYAALAAIQASG